MDVQNDFCTGGALAVPDGEGVVPVVNRLMDRFERVILTQDWHPSEHLSFASAHGDTRPFDTVSMPYGPQTAWPDHCVAGSSGAAFHRDLRTEKAQAVIRKGWRREIDSYSAFFENDRKTPTGLAGLLRELQVARVVLCGLATDFCVAYSALDARRLGLEATVVLDGCRAIDLEGSLAAATAEMGQNGVNLVQSADL